ncbi:hypothetical protein [Cohnella silvisoli]|uniref:YtkA-like domain-containing protein n=1 Tax=Cohnella silvisoli TaxID=2873699 RepID=A0ABV1KQB4_9BACL|nr:hypothetical protein [Cohnella silvisoli]MCD9020906.1 hypothetical protein [Cohnella silvisoli]
MKRILLMMLIIAVALLTACGKKTDHDKMAQSSNGTAEHGSHAGMNSSEEKGVPTSASWHFATEKPKPNTDTAITIQIKDKDGNAINKFDINHEKKLHLIVVSKDLSYFNHIHPEYKDDGTFEITTKFPNSGDYKLIADYIPTGGSATSQSKWVKVEGTVPALAEITPEESLVKTINDIEVTLTFDHLMADMDLNLTFNMVDAKTKEPITDLQPYLGAVGHVVILSADAEQYLHVHPTKEDAKGPNAQFMTKFPQSGVYKIWGQFQRNDETFIVPFVVKVP